MCYKGILLKYGKVAEAMPIKSAVQGKMGLQLTFRLLCLEEVGGRYRHQILSLIWSMSGPGPSSFQIFLWRLAVCLLPLATVGEENQQSHHSEIFWLLRGCQLFSASSYPFCAGFFSESLLPALLSCVYLRDIVDDRVQGSNHHHSRVLRTALDT